jgi:hypothetical protein
MSTFQRLFLALMPRKLAEDMEKDSRLWHIRCLTCRHEVSIWDIGGIKYRAYGRSRTLRTCTKCGRIRCHEVYRKD